MYFCISKYRVQYAGDEILSYNDEVSDLLYVVQICSLRLYNSLVERCFNNCVDSFTRKALTKQEETCVRRCAEKFLKHSMRVGMRFAELNQGAATQD